MTSRAEFPGRIARAPKAAPPADDLDLGMGEDELEALKTSKAAITTEGADDSQELFIGTEGQKFSFEADSPIPVSFERCSARTGDVDAVVQFVSGA